MDGHLAGTLAGRGGGGGGVGCDELSSVTCNGLNRFFVCVCVWKRWLPEQQKCKICLVAKNCDDLERNIFAKCENDMHRNGNLG